MNSFYKQFKYNLLYPTANSVSKLLSLRPVSANAGEDHVFVVTAGRSGSTLLAGLLNNFEDIHFPPEQWALWFAISKYYGLPFQTWDVFCHNLIARFSTDHANWGMHDANWTELAARLHELPKEKRTIPDLMRSFYAMHASIYGKSNITFTGDQTPISTILFRTVYAEFPHARFVFLVRNPLDVVASLMRNPEIGYADLNKAVWRWKNSVRAFHHLREAGRNLHVVRYEDLVAAPEHQLAEVAGFIGLHTTGGSPKEIRTVDMDVLGVREQGFHANLAKPIDASYSGKWSDLLDERAVRHIGKTLADEARHFGYDLQLP